MNTTFLKNIAILQERGMKLCQILYGKIYPIRLNWNLIPTREKI